MRLNDKDLRICLVAYLMTAVSLAWGHEQGPEYIEALDTRLTITPSGMLEIAHDIRFHPHGDEIRRGLFFDLPDEVGPLSGFSARINGREVEHDLDDGAIVVASPEPLAIQQTHRMQVSYRAAAPLREVSGGDSELAWEPVIGQFELPWRGSSVTVSWPEGPAPQALPPGGERIDGGWRISFSGAGGETAAGAKPSADAGQALVFRWQPGAFPASVVRKHRAHWGWRAVLLVAVIGLWGLIHSFWRAVGRDPDIGRVRPSASPPSGISPAAARYIERMGFDTKAFVAALVSLRVKGRISLEPHKKEKKLDIVRLGSGHESPSPGEQALEKSLFADSTRVELKPGSSVGSKASSALGKALGREHRGRHFETNSRERIQSFVLGAAVILTSIGALISELGGVIERDPVVVALGFFGVAAGLVIPLVYFELMKAPTRAGVAVRREVEALRLYMSDASPATSSVDEFAKLLPYAVALEAEEKWQARFGDRLGDCEGSRAADVIAWYRKIQDEFDSTAAIVTIIAASAATTSATASAGGASAGGV